MDEQLELSRRERQIMDILYAQKEGTVNQIHDGLPDPPAHTAVRTLLSILEAKGYVRRNKRGRENIYIPRQRRSRAGRSALRRVLDVFFEGSLEKAVGAHLSDTNAELSQEELQRIVDLINQARKRGD
jgi:BlaI family transcriptional regulator, penicillinase repressor